VSYEEVTDILSRYDTLKGANRDLMVHVNTVSDFHIPHLIFSSSANRFV
jgi:hypothetical protein